MTVKFRLKSLIEGKKTTENRKITNRDIAAEAGVSTNTLIKIANQSMAQIGLVTINKLCKYLGCRPADLLIRIPDDKQETAGE